jgi:hypothetical protein
MSGHPALNRLFEFNIDEIYRGASTAEVSIKIIERWSRIPTICPQENYMDKAEVPFWYTILITFATRVTGVRVV